MLGRGIISDLFSGGVKGEIGNLGEGGRSCSSSLCGPQFSYLYSEGIDVLFVTLAFPGCQFAFWKGELV